MCCIIYSTPLLILSGVRRCDGSVGLCRNRANNFSLSFFWFPNDDKSGLGVEVSLIPVIVSSNTGISEIYYRV